MQVSLGAQLGIKSAPVSAFHDQVTNRSYVFRRNGIVTTIDNVTKEADDIVLYMCADHVVEQLKQHCRPNDLCLFN
jgi:hypothetical protein